MSFPREGALLGIIVLMGVALAWLGLQVAFSPQMGGYGHLHRLHLEPQEHFADRDNVSTASQRIGEAPFRGARVRGFMEKRGMLSPTYYTGSTAFVRDNAFERWLDAYMKGNPVSHAPLPYPYCQVYINHHYKFIWIKGHKVASTSMQGPLGYVCDCKWGDPPGANYSLCSEAGFLYKNATDAELRKWWKEYFVFGVIRNPYARFASAEEYILKMVPEKCGKPSFNETCQDPYIDARRCKQGHCCEDKVVTHHYRHFTDQTTCLFTESLAPVVDFIGEVENLEADFGTIISEINRRRNSSVSPLTSSIGRANARNRRLLEEKAYAYELFKQHPECLGSIRQFYNRDFMLLGYEELETID